MLEIISIFFLLEMCSKYTVTLAPTKVAKLQTQGNYTKLSGQYELTITLMQNFN